MINFFSTNKKIIKQQLDMIEYLIDSMDINDFLQLVDDFESLYWINDI